MFFVVAAAVVVVVKFLRVSELIVRVKYIVAVLFVSDE